MGLARGADGGRRGSAYRLGGEGGVEGVQVELPEVGVGPAEDVSQAFEDMGADLLAAEAAADAAVCRRKAGEMRDATADERRAAILAERCEDPVTPALHATEARARLTPAERETAVLAAAGRPNKEIAEQLFLSPRTVENRLQRVYEKLGISGRTELPDTLSPED